ncbi:MAG: hypothetical protein Solivirus3_32 [Solivirus sp.]|uniref:Uncharacterized protein n=1 Tax=Solivirus sp. TaxID=2487772 RepID=A0A3G5AFS9_9VIRU|nr:MAG: hypothetical protein Solivirus3_32 [Solivirus sp.]
MIAPKYLAIAQQLESEFPNLHCPRTFEEYFERMSRNKCVTPEMYQRTRSSQIFMTPVLDNIDRKQKYLTSNFIQQVTPFALWGWEDYMKLVFDNPNNLIWIYSLNGTKLISSEGDYYDFKNQVLLTTGITENSKKKNSYIIKIDIASHKELYMCILPHFVVLIMVNHISAERHINFIGWLEPSDASHNLLMSIREFGNGNSVPIKCFDLLENEDSNESYMIYRSQIHVSESIGVGIRILQSNLSEKGFYLKDNKLYVYADPNYNGKRISLPNNCKRVFWRLNQLVDNNGIVHTFSNNEYYISIQITENDPESVVITKKENRYDILSCFWCPYAKYYLTNDEGIAMNHLLSRIVLNVLFNNQTLREDIRETWKLQADHIDMNIAHNWANNLQWLTQPENISCAHGFKHIGLKVNKDDTNFVAVFADPRVLDRFLSTRGQTSMHNHLSQYAYNEEFKYGYWLSQISKEEYDQNKSKNNDLQFYKQKGGGGMCCLFRSKGTTNWNKSNSLSQAAKSLRIVNELGDVLKSISNKNVTNNEVNTVVLENKTYEYVECYYFSVQEQKGLVSRASSIKPKNYIQLYVLEFLLDNDKSIRVSSEQWHQANAEFEINYPIKFGPFRRTPSLNIVCTCEICS